MHQLLFLAVYVGSGALAGAVSAFYFDVDWCRLARRCPTYGDFLGRILLGTIAGLPVLLLAIIVSGIVWIMDRPAVKKVLNRPMCRKATNG